MLRPIQGPDDFSPSGPFLGSLPRGGLERDWLGLMFRFDASVWAGTGRANREVALEIGGPHRPL